MRKIFTNAGYGAPGSITQNAGSMIPVLQACLVDGFGDQTPTSITRSGTTATMILPNAIDFTRTGVLNISGCDQADYNGEFRVTVVDPNTVTFTVANSPVTPATGTIVSRQDGAGWTMPFAGTDLAAFKQGAGSNGLYLDVDDASRTDSAKVRGYETMSGVGVGLGQFPTTVQDVNCYWTRGTTGSDWIVIADESFVMVWCPDNVLTYSTAGAWFFGDYREVAGVNVFGTLLVSSNNSANAFYSLAILDASPASVVYGRAAARDYTQLGSSAEIAIVGNSSLTGYTGASGAGMDYPEPITGNVYMQELMVMHKGGAKNLIGYVDGAFTMLHYLPFGNSSISYFAGSGDFAGDEFVYMPCQANTALVFRISD